MEILKLRFYSSNIARRQYWSSEQICLELKVWMSSFLNIRSSRLEVSYKKAFLKFLENSLKISKLSVMQSFFYASVMLIFFSQLTFGLLNPYGNSLMCLAVLILEIIPQKIAS